MDPMHSASLAPREQDLAGLRLSLADFQALARQGFVAREFRQGRGPFFKLRWRQGGRQCVRYLGQDPVRAEQVRLALESLQRPQRTARQLARLLSQTRQRLLQVKRLLEPQAGAQGGHYHGYTLRRSLAPRHG